MISNGTLHEDVVKIQTKLTEFGYDPGPVDGWFGRLTTRAVATFQRTKGLFEDGIIGPDTAKALGLELDFAKFQPPPLRRNLTAALLDPGLKAKLLKTSEIGRTHYEELVCVGYEPQMDRLEAIVAIKQPNGYQGNPCAGGSSEHVRFFVDWNHDGTWTDVGVVSFDTHDLPFAEPRMHAVHLALRVRPSDCHEPRLPMVRAILSWREVPPATDPDWTPTWGNSMQVRIQSATSQRIAKGDVPAIDTDILASLPHAKLLSPALIASYAKQVPLARWAAPQLRKLAGSKALSLAGIESLAAATQVKVDAVAKALASLQFGDTRYERLCQVGYDSDRRSLAAVVHVEQNFGYSGTSCDPGSREYVRFWRWDPRDARWIGLGVSSVVVHDIDQSDRGRLSYAVVLPVDFSELRRPCDAAPTVLRVRATLSWNHEPPEGDPDWEPTWGNQVEAKFDIETGHVVGEPTLYVEGLSTQAICEIDPSSGMWDGPVHDSPFGGTVMISGRFSHLGSLGPNHRLFYRIRVGTPTGSGGLANPETLTNPFRTWLDDFSTAIPVQRLVQQLATDGWYEYLERPNIVSRQFALGVWSTQGKNGLWAFELDAEIRDASGNLVESVDVRRISCDGTLAPPSAIRVMLDNLTPELSLTIDGGSCHTYEVGTVITGTFEVTDTHLGGWGLAIEPSGFGHLLSYTPSTYAGGTHASGTWQLQTGAMPACGYVIRMSAIDRTIVGSYVDGPSNAAFFSQGGWTTTAPSAGFCIIAQV